MKRTLTTAARSAPSTARGGSTWADDASLPPLEKCTESEYLAYNANRLMEYSAGRLEILAMPTTSHQRMVRCLFRALFAFIDARNLGEVLFAPLKLRTRPGKFREPDLLFAFAEHADWIGEKYWEKADLVVEVVSPEDPSRDLETKRREYAAAGIPEYWIVDPRNSTITVLSLSGSRYFARGEYKKGEKTESALLKGFSVEVSAVFTAKK